MSYGKNNIRDCYGRQMMWTPHYLNIPENTKEMLLIDIEAEKAVIEQYKVHIKIINDEYVRTVLTRIIKDEEYHIMVLQALMEEL